MTTALTTFAFNDTNVRTVQHAGQHWFIATDVCRVLGLVNTTMALKPLAEDQKTTLRISEGRSVNAISESGFYKLALRCHDRPGVREFQDWVTRTVLPALRKDGMYVVGEEKVVTGEMTEDELVLKALECLKAKVDRLQKENSAMSTELNVITVDEWRALKHLYLSRHDKSRMGTTATFLAKLRGTELESQRRIMTDGTVVRVNVYPRKLLEEAWERIQAFDKSLKKDAA